MEIERVVDIAAAQERVWAALADVERWPEWTPSVSSVERLDRAAFGIGSRARIRQPRLPIAIWTVTALEPGRWFEWQSAAPGLKTVAGHRVDAAGDRACRVGLSLAWSGPLVYERRLNLAEARGALAVRRRWR